MTIWSRFYWAAALLSSTLVEAGVPSRNVERDTFISMFVSNLPCAPAGRFHRPMVVTMRPIAEAQVDLVREPSSRYPHAHGAPVHVGDPKEIGISDLGRPDLTFLAGEIADADCGVRGKALGLTIPPSLLLRADQAIE